MSTDELAKLLSTVGSALKMEHLRTGLRRAVVRSSRTFELLKTYSYVRDYTDYLREVKSRVFNDIEYYIDATINAVEKTHGRCFFCRDAREVHKLIDEIIGPDKKVIIKAKSMVTEEVRLRQYLQSRGHEVFETDLGEFLIQIANEKPMHATAPAAHIPRERAAELLGKVGVKIGDGSIASLVKGVREFLRGRLTSEGIGITGANAVSSDTGSVVLIHNEGNIGFVVSSPKVHIAITGVEKIMPTIKDAFIQAIVQSAYAGNFPPSYISVVSAPSSTSDIEFERVYGVHGPLEYYLMLLDNGRIKALSHDYLREQLYCIRCGRCQVECPVWSLVGGYWGGDAYVGPMGLGWTSIVEGIQKGATLALLCLNCGRCKEVCPLNIDIPRIARYLKSILCSVIL